MNNPIGCTPKDSALQRNTNERLSDLQSSKSSAHRPRLVNRSVLNVNGSIALEADRLEAQAESMYIHGKWP